MPPSHTNAVQMIMTLKLMGLAFEVHDSWKSNASEDSNKLDQKYQNIDVSPRALDIFHYAFAHTGVLTGPYYRFRHSIHIRTVSYYLLFLRSQGLF